ncbi:Hydroxyethylthiazole kinase [Phanerochaete sordida]|uniref:Hydroxyethylthiazole kinase n=1 Tax=Phanerochaete sordida TaxID=48140 RepID=A0A9P3GHA7_9APHY|nr:Hydroxyethylthiazole kinase [Phanerochaete sordida]
MAKPAVDYSLYLVTGRDLLPPGKDYLESLEEALQGGVTLVQVREKTADTGEILDIARQTKALCDRYNVPLIIDDRVDVALAVGAAGVHLGQTDMPVPVARALLPPHAVIGKTCNTAAHVAAALADGADYVGLGPVWGTATKRIAHPPAGPRGIAALLAPLAGTPVRAVAIAGINAANVLHCLWGATTPDGHTLDGVAVVSDIVASPEPRAAAQRLSTAIRAFYAAPHHTFARAPSAPPYTADALKAAAGAILADIKRFAPLVHQITNNVVTTQSANATLALGGSPIMATAPQEMADLSRATGALLVNFGTIQNLDGMLEAGRHANMNRKPVVFDPVGVGATAYRRESAQGLLRAWQATVIKGNAGELAALADSAEVQAKGVDSVGGFADPARFVRDLARAHRCIVVLTGVVDWVSDGTHVARLANGHALLGAITGSGCMVGTAVAAFCAGASCAAAAARAANAPEDGALVRGDMFLAAVGGVLAVTVAAELAAARADVQGSGTFLPALIDELGRLGAEDFMQRANVALV